VTTGTPIKRRTQTDPEIKAIQKVLAIVDDLPVSTKRRVLEYALSRTVSLEFGPYPAYDQDVQAKSVQEFTAMTATEASRIRNR